MKLVCLAGLVIALVSAVVWFPTVVNGFSCGGPTYCQGPCNVPSTACGCNATVCTGSYSYDGLRANSQCSDPTNDGDGVGCGSGQQYTTPTGQINERCSCGTDCATQQYAVSCPQGTCLNICNSGPTPVPLPGATPAPPAPVCVPGSCYCAGSLQGGPGLACVPNPNCPGAGAACCTSDNPPGCSGGVGGSSGGSGGGDPDPCNNGASYGNFTICNVDETSCIDNRVSLVSGCSANRFQGSLDRSCSAWTGLSGKEATGTSFVSGAPVYGSGDASYVHIFELPSTGGDPVWIDTIPTGPPPRTFGQTDCTTCEPNNGPCRNWCTDAGSPYRCTNPPATGNGKCYQGYNWTVPSYFRDGESHYVVATADDDSTPSYRISEDNNYMVIGYEELSTGDSEFAYNQTGNQGQSQNYVKAFSCPGPGSPAGTLTGGTCATVTGWAQDPTSPTTAAKVGVFIDKDDFTGAADLMVDGSDSVTTDSRNANSNCSGGANCGFTIDVSALSVLHDGNTHRVDAVVYDNEIGQSSVPPPAPYIDNDFETGGLTGWTPVGTAAIADSTNDTESAGNFSQYVKFTGASSIQRQVVGSGSEPLKLTYRLRGCNSCSGNSLIVEYCTGSGCNSNFRQITAHNLQGQTTWMTSVIDLPLALTGQTFTIRFRNISATSRLDDIQLYKYTGLSFAYVQLSGERNITCSSTYWQTQGGDVTAMQGIASNFPNSADYISEIAASHPAPGIVITPDDIEIGAAASVSTTNWQVKNSTALSTSLPAQFDYAYVKDRVYVRVDNTKIREVAGNLSVATLADLTSGGAAVDGVYYIHAGSVTTTADITNIGTNIIVVLSEGDVTIGGKINTSVGGNFVVAAKGDINVSGSVGGASDPRSRAAEIQGVYLAQGKFNTGISASAGSGAFTVWSDSFNTVAAGVSGWTVGSEGGFANVINSDSEGSGVSGSYAEITGRVSVTSPNIPTSSSSGLKLNYNLRGDVQGGNITTQVQYCAGAGCSSWTTLRSVANTAGCSGGVCSWVAYQDTIPVNNTIIRVRFNDNWNGFGGNSANNVRLDELTVTSTIAANYRTLRMEGAITGLGGIGLDRSTPADAPYPAEYFSFRPDYLVNIPPGVLRQDRFFKEINP